METFSAGVACMGIKHSLLVVSKNSTVSLTSGRSLPRICRTQQDNQQKGRIHGHEAQLWCDALLTSLQQVADSFPGCNKTWADCLIDLQRDTDPRQCSPLARLQQSSRCCYYLSCCCCRSIQIYSFSVQPVRTAEGPVCKASSPSLRWLELPSLR